MGRPAFYHVGNIYLAAVEIYQFQHGVQQFPGRPYEGDTLKVFLLTGTLAYEHHLCVFVTVTENESGPAGGKSAQFAV
jgi:hypothetical protein